MTTATTESAVVLARKQRYQQLQELSYDEVQVRLARAEGSLTYVSKRLGVETEVARRYEDRSITVPLKHIEDMTDRIDAFLEEPL